MKLSSKNLNPSSYSPHPTNTYTYEVTIAPKIWYSILPYYLKMNKFKLLIPNWLALSFLQFLIQVFKNSRGRAALALTGSGATYRGYLDEFFLSLNFCHSISITHHLIFHTCLAPSLTFHHSIFFTLFVGPIIVTRWSFFFFFPFFQYPNSPNPVKKKDKELNSVKNVKKPLVWKEKEKEKKKNMNTHSEPSEEKKRWSKVGFDLQGSVHVVLFTEMPLSYELWKLKTVKMCFHFS